MKRIVTVMAIAVASSVATLVGYDYFTDHKKEVVIREVIKEQPNFRLASSASASATLDFTEAARLSTPGVVHIRATQVVNQPMNRANPFHDFFGDEFFYGPRQRNNRRSQATGSGVVISEEGYVVTNNHVINNAQKIEISLSDGRVLEAELIATDPSTDLAVLKVESDDLSALPFANSDDVQVGEWVLAVGNPFNLESTVTAGIVSAKGRNINILKDKYALEAFIQTDAAVNPGNSGGALVDLEGNLIGINTAIATPTGSFAGYSFAVPSNLVKKVAEDLIKFGVVQRGFLGVMIRDMDGTLADKLDLDITNGVYVDSLMPESAAARSGIKKGDVIVEVGGRSVQSTPELQEAIGRYRPGDKVQVMVNREGSEKLMEVTLKNKNGGEELVAKPVRGVLRKLGLELETVNKKELEKLGVEKGVKVKGILQGKVRNHTRMREGFVITRIDGKQVNSPEDAEQILNKKKGGGVMIEGVYPGMIGKAYYALGLD